MHCNKAVLEMNTKICDFGQKKVDHRGEAEPRTSCEATQSRKQIKFKLSIAFIEVLSRQTC